MDLYNYLNPGEEGDNLKRWCQDENQLSRKKSGRNRKLKSVNEFFLTMMRLRVGLFEYDLALRFEISESTVSRIIITWINFMYVQLGQLAIWAPREVIDLNMPQAFKEKYPSTRIIIDATEIKCERPSSFVLQSGTYSHYKSTNTYKGLLGIAPDGTLTFVSSLYSGSISDKELTYRCGLLKKPFNDNDQIMADKGFTIDDILPPNVQLNIPPFLRDKQFTVNDIQETQKIASLRIHVERKINRIRNFHIFDRVLPLTLGPVVNQIWTVTALLTNFQSPILKLNDNIEQIDDLEIPMDEDPLGGF